MEKFWNTPRQLNALGKAPRVGGQQFAVRLPIFNFEF